MNKEESNQVNEPANGDKQTNIYKQKKQASNPNDKHIPQVMNDLGIYVGQADPHTVEIETNEGPKAFQLTERSAEEIKTLQPNDKVKFEYYINEHKQNVLQSIEKMKGNKSSPEIGIYNGQQDSHTIEIETKNGPTAFQLSDEAKQQVSQLQIGEKVSYTYQINGSQYIIETIKQIE